MAANPYSDGWRAWDERYADQVLSKRNWQIAAGCAALLSLVLGTGLVGLAVRTRYVVYAVTVDRQGYALTAAVPLTPVAAPDLVGRIERYEIASFIHEARAVSSDPAVEQQDLNALLAHARGAADQFLNDYYHADNAVHNPFKVAQKQTVTVQVESILRRSARTYEVRWSEVRRDLNGAAVGGPTHWEAELQATIVPPAASDAIITNPLGFYVAQLSWTEQQD